MMLPAPVKPEILLRMTENQSLQGRSAALSQDLHGLGPMTIVGGIDFILDFEPVMERAADANGADDKNGHVEFEAEEGGDAMGRRRPAEEIHEDAVRAGVLIDQGAENAAAPQQVSHLAEVAFLG